MPTILLHDKKTIESFLRCNIQLNIYSIGDLDDFFWPYTTWYGLTTDNAPEAIALLYTGQTLPTLLALSEQQSIMGELLDSIIHLLPKQFYAHLSPGLESIFQDTHTVESHGAHYKMGLRNLSAVEGVDCSQALRLTHSELNDITKLYKMSYPGNWFDPRMLETGQYFGIRKNDELASIAGIHVYSEEYRVAALGNITTHPLHRKQGYGTAVTARLCRSLSAKVDHIGLNVKANNSAAISCYEKLGFNIIASYGEFMIKRNPIG